MRHKKEQPTQSLDAARACLLRNHSENELAALLLTAEARGLTQFVRETIESFEWLRDARARLRALGDPPRGIELAIALGPLADQEVAHLADMPGAEAMLAELNSARELAVNVRRARQLVSKTAIFGHKEPRPDKLKSFARLPPEDLVALLLVISERTGFGPRFTATEAMAFSVLAKVETPTADSDQRLNTWSKRLRRVEKHAQGPLVELGRVFLQIAARRVPTLAEAETIYARVRDAAMSLPQP